MKRQAHDRTLRPGRPVHSGTLGLWAASALLAVGATASADESRRTDNWPMFRGNPQLTGVATGRLPDRLSVRWKFEASEAFGSSAAIGDGRVYVGCDDNFLYSFDLGNGKVQWKYEAKGMIRSSPTVQGGAVFVGDDEGFLHAVDARTGSPRWAQETGAQIVSSPNVDGDRVVFGSYDNSVYCVSAADGKLLWKFETKGRVHGTPGIVDGQALVAGCDEFLHVLRLSDGQSAARISMGSVSGASAAISGSRVFVATYGGHVLGVDWKSQQVVWDFHEGDQESPYLASAAVNDRAVIVGGRDKKLRAFDPQSGKLQWSFPTRGKLDSSPVIVGDRVFVGSADGNLYGVAVDTGDELWRFEAGSPITASPSVGGGRLVVGTEDGILYCFGEE